MLGGEYQADAECSRGRLVTEQCDTQKVTAQLEAG